MPQIFIGDTHVGGYDDMIALHRAGGLEPLLAGLRHERRTATRRASQRGDRVAEFTAFRKRMNERILAEPNQVVRRFFALDTQTYQAGALDVKTKELLGLVASLVLRCDDCISYHVAQCKEAGVNRDEMFEAFSVGLVVGGSIVIPHLRRAVDFLDQLEARRSRVAGRPRPRLSATPAYGGPRPLLCIIRGIRHNPRGATRLRAASRLHWNPQMTQTITVIRGDGIGPEIMDATLHVLDAMQLGLQYEFADAGLVALEKHGELLPAATMDSIRRNRIALKSPLTTPVGEGFSLDQRRAAQALRPVRQRAPGQVVPEHQVALPVGRGPDHRAREHRGRLHRRRPVAVGGRRDRAAHAEGHPPRLRAHRALRLRPGAPDRPQEGHGGAQGQHPEVDLGPVPQDRARSGGASTPTSSATR